MREQAKAGVGSLLLSVEPCCPCLFISSTGVPGRSVAGVGKDEPLKPMPALSAGAVGDQFYEDRAAGLAQRIYQRG